MNRILPSVALLFAALVSPSPAHAIIAIPPCMPRDALFVPGECAFGMLMFEDLYPNRGDFDLDDLVVAYNWELFTDADGRVYRAHLTLVPLAAGGQIDTGVAVSLPVPRDQLYLNAGDNDLIEESGASTVIRVIPSVRDAFGVASGTHVNPDGVVGPDGRRIVSRQAEPTYIDVRFQTPVANDPAVFGPGDIFLFHVEQPSVEVHLPSYPGTASFDASLYGQGDDGSVAGVRYFVDHAGIPFAIALPHLGPYAREGVAFESVYPEVVAFGASGGQEAADFYSHPVTSADVAVFYAPPLVLPQYHPRSLYRAGIMQLCR